MSVSSTEQASSADNISEEVGGNMARPRTHATDLSAINTSTHHINTGNITILLIFYRITLFFGLLKR